VLKLTSNNVEIQEFFRGNTPGVQTLLKGRGRGWETEKEGRIEGGKENGDCPPRYFWLKCYTATILWPALSVSV